MNPLEHMDWIECGCEVCHEIHCLEFVFVKNCERCCEDWEGEQEDEKDGLVADTLVTVKPLV